MGIQICEKLREDLGWRQIGSCHKWDSGAGNWAVGGPGLHAPAAHGLSIKSPSRDPFPGYTAKHQPEEISPPPVDSNSRSVTYF